MLFCLVLNTITTCIYGKRGVIPLEYILIVSYNKKERRGLRGIRIYL